MTGRGPFDGKFPVDFLGRVWLLERAEALQVADKKPEPLTLGRDWLALGYKPGKIIGSLTSLADRLRDERGLTREEVLAKAEEMPGSAALVDTFVRMLESPPAG